VPRGRPRRLSGEELVQQLNTVVAQLIKENRQLKRQIDKLAARASGAASGAVDRNLRAIQKRAQQALGATPTRRRRRAGSAAKPRGRRKAPANP
jgi:cell division septum initiation protein DivIVA